MIMPYPTIEQLPPPPQGRTGWPWTEGTPVSAPAELAGLPRVSIVTPSYNQGQYLEETIRSILLQGYPNLEYIVVDGGSTDGSVEIIRKYEEHLAGWVSEKDKGQSHAINKGFARSTGEVFNYIASDDLLEPGALLAVGRTMRDRKAPWVVGQVRYRQAGVKDWPLPVWPEKHFTDWFLWCPVPQPGSFWTRDVHKQTGDFREDLHYYFDYDMWMRFRFRLGLKPVVITEELAVYRLHDQSKTVSHNPLFEIEGKQIRGSYEPLLTPAEQRKLWFARRRWRARRVGAKALALLAGGHPLSALSKLGAALLLWPPLLFDLTGVQAARRAFGRRGAADTARFEWGSESATSSTV